MNTVFMLVYITTGPAGHGEPGVQSYSVYTVRDSTYVLGEPGPVFTTREKAEAFIESWPSYRRIGWLIKEVEVR